MSWSDLAELAKSDPRGLLEVIKDSGQYDVALQWFSFNDVPDDCRLMLLELHVLWLLKQHPVDPTAVKQVLEQAGEDCELDLCERLIKQLPHNECKLCVIEFLIDRPYMTEEYLEQLHLLTAGIKILSCLKNQEDSEGLAPFPHLLLEQLLMNMEIEVASHAVKNVTQDLEDLNTPSSPFSVCTIDTLVETYAEKAMEFPIIEETADMLEKTLTDSEDIYMKRQFVMPLQPPTKEEWTPDTAVSICMACGTEKFSMFSRRHHCRRCGRVVCGTCSQNTMRVEGYGHNLLRVCDDCYAQSKDVNALNGISFGGDIRRSKYEHSGLPSSLKQHSGPPTVPGSMRQRTNTIDSACMNFWTLNPSEEQNEDIRNEFFYEQAPSVSLCLSLLSLHSRPATFMLKQCDHLFSMLHPNPESPTIQVDYSLIISMMRTLFWRAKYCFLEAGDSRGVEHSDIYLSRLGLIQMLVTANCRHLIPEEELTSNDTIRRLRDRLVEDERMELALEVSTKYGLDMTGVWANWGMNCLRAGDWLAAQEKFSRCLKTPADHRQTSQEDPLLKEIIAVIECSPSVGINKATTVVQCLSSLSDIQSGKFPQRQPKPREMDASKLEECCYYFRKYGSHISVVRFYEKHGKIDLALQYLQQKNCETDVFLSGLYLPCLQTGRLTLLFQSLAHNNPRLTGWASHLLAACRHLQRENLLHSLLQLQLFMKDYLRAAMTNIQFYLSSARTYDELFERLRYLTFARQNFEMYTNVSRGKEGPNKQDGVLVLPAEAVTKYIKTISLQKEITNYLVNCAAGSTAHLFPEDEDVQGESRTSLPPLPPTLFASSAQRVLLAASVMVAGENITEGFTLVHKIIQEYKLDGTRVFTIAARRMLSVHRTDDVISLVDCFKHPDTEHKYNSDEVVGSCIRALVSQPGRYKDIEALIKVLVSDTNKINAFILCEKLKSAYLLAVRLERVADVQHIMATAERTGQDSVRTICEKWLSLHGQRSNKRSN